MVTARITPHTTPRPAAGCVTSGVHWDACAMPSEAPAVGAWAPLRHSGFRALWLAVLASNIGTWVQDVAASWFMSEQTGSPLMVAAVQSATTLPVVAFAL